MASTNITVTPFQAVDIRPSPRRASRSCFPGSSRNPTLAIYITSDTNDTDADHKNPAYQLELSPAPLFSYWPPSTSLVRLHAAVPLESSAIATATIKHGLFAAFMCSVGSISVPAEKATLTLATREVTVYSGLGHGMWYDYVLTGLLGRDKKKPLRWSAEPDNWRTIKDTEHGREYTDMQWAGRGKPVGGSLVLKDERDSEILAVYKPRSARWTANRKQAQTGDDGEADGVGCLGIMVADLGEEALEHMILNCASIEEQIMRSRGFNGAYHGCWAG